LERLTSCEYVHETRHPLPDGSRLTDHSGLAVRVAMTAATPLLPSDPTTAVSGQAEPSGSGKVCRPRPIATPRARTPQQPTWVPPTWAG
ncbi:MAG: hypothetical protein ACRDTT_35265, partial [Pseudonocardiaceae bacterium]